MALIQPTSSPKQLKQCAGAADTRLKQGARISGLNGTDGQRAQPTDRGDQDMLDLMLLWRAAFEDARRRNEREAEQADRKQWMVQQSGTGADYGLRPRNRCGASQPQPSRASGRSVLAAGKGDGLGDPKGSS